MIVIVLGMHRAGTSMLSSVLHGMGVVMGPPDHLTRFDPESQPRGYWEDRSFVELNQDILTVAGGQWDRPPSPGAIIGVSSAFADRIAALIKERDTRLRWGWKDPRTCLTIGCYQAALAGLDVRYLRITRQRSDVVSSLIRRGLAMNDTPPNVLGLIDDYERRITDFFDVYDPPRQLFSYEAMTDPDRAAGRVQRLAEFLDISDAGLIEAGSKRIAFKVQAHQREE